MCSSSSSTPSSRPKEVEDYQRFGVVVSDAQGYMTKIVEKPKEPISRLANIGLYYIRDTAALFAGVDAVKAAPKNKGEYYLTDAFQHMIERGRKIRTAEVGGWYDCGEVGTLLESNEILLRKGRARRPAAVPAGVTIKDPVYLEDGVSLERCTIGPNVSIESGARVVGGSLTNAIVGAGAVLTDCRLDGAILGERVKATGVTGRASLGADSEVTVR
ncbi:MAG: hypothetical protein JF590_02785 [Gemmatimonadetes bacterium]|nr:hypothetical protein [Gemmatimonadota bacterium]